MPAEVRTRVAPSPTGDPHVGTAYMALFNLALARRHGGQFLLRIEDTDRARSSQASEQRIFESLRWLGLDWDEGPDVGGPNGPYRQSERREIYAAHAQRLLDAGHAFHCFCTPERLDALRRGQQARGETPGYDGHCLDLDPAEVARRQRAGERHVVRLRVPRDGDCTFDDVFRGSIAIPWAQVDMQVLVKADGMPTYHLAVVVDDHLMRISHVMRGEEWISSVPKHLLLYRCFGWEPPLHAHLPLLRNPDRSKLSKRKNPTSITFYRDAGYLPEALLNFLGMMGGGMPADAERFTLGEFVAGFDLGRIRLGGPVFDLAKLDWLNGTWIRSLPPRELALRWLSWRGDAHFIERVTPLLQGRVSRFSQVAPAADYLLGDIRTPDAAAFAAAGLDADLLLRMLAYTAWTVDTLADWHADVLKARVEAIAGALGLGLRAALPPLFLAIGGRGVTLPLFDSMEVLGRDLVRQRLRAALDVLGGVSKKQQKRFEGEFARIGAAAASDGGDDEQAN
jgi:glutamyl-tRNA synthetase